MARRSLKKSDTAFERAKKFGGRPSVSRLLTELVQRHRKELERELGG